MLRAKFQTYSKGLCICLIFVFLFHGKQAAADTNPSQSADLPPCAVEVDCDQACRTLYNKARDLHNAGHYAEALQGFTSLYQRTPRCSILLALIPPYLELKEYEKARQLLNMTPADVTTDLNYFQRRKKLQEDLDSVSQTQPAASPTASAPRPDPSSDQPSVKAPAVTPQPLSSQQANDAASATPSFAAPARAQSAPVLFASAEPTRDTRRPPVYKRWWLWTSMGAVVTAATAVGIGVYLANATQNGPAFPSDFSGYGNPRP